MGYQNESEMSLRQIKKAIFAKHVLYESHKHFTARQQFISATYQDEAFVNPFYNEESVIKNYLCDQEIN